MIPNTDPRIIAHFRPTDTGGTKSLPVLAWSDAGEALVPSQNGHIVPAHRLRGFTSITTGECADMDYQQIIPNTTGHQIEYTDGDETFRSTPIGWGLRNDGSVEVLDADVTGYIDRMDSNGVLTDPARDHR